MGKETEMEQEVTTESRRKFLKTAGKFAVYTPPALMLMSNANATYVKESSGYCRPGKHKKYGSKKRSYKRKFVKRRYGPKRRIARRW